MYELVAYAQNRQFFEIHEQDIHRWVEGAGVPGVVGFDSRIRLRPKRDWGVDATMCWLETTNGVEQAEREYQAFYRSLLKGFPKLVDWDAKAE